MNSARQDSSSKSVKAQWRASTYSGGQGNCVEIADNIPGLVPVRDSTRPGGPVVVCGRPARRAFIGYLRWR
ncbi:DUF397 domain-containing protein [Streptomyces sp. NPDC053542]|uniref:DUF397 domain-containing protein n=1 Tax=Streptomyces sp. NPDC053542 TaxID=3365710 RepID=UPI0037D3829E